MGAPIPKTPIINNETTTPITEQTNVFLALQHLLNCLNDPISVKNFRFATIFSQAFFFFFCLYEICLPVGQVFDTKQL